MHLHDIPLEPLFVDHLGPWLLTYGIHSSIAILLGLLLGRWMASSLARARLWKFLLLGPLLTASLKLEGAAPMPAAVVPPESAQSASLFQAGWPEIPAGLEAARPPELATPLAAPSPAAAGAPALAAPEAPLSFAFLLVGVWALLASGSVLHFLVRRRGFVRRIGVREELRDGALHASLKKLLANEARARRVKLTEAKGLTSPVAIGRAEICLPANIHSELGPHEQRSLLAHELAHLDRRDPAWLLASQLLERLFFFQPLLGCVRRRLQEEMEFLADEWAVRRTRDPLHMARCLARFAEWVSPDAAPGLEPNMANSPSQLVRRIEAVLHPREAGNDRRTSRRVVLGAVLGLLLLSSIGPRLYGASLSPQAIEALRVSITSAWGKPQEHPGGEPATPTSGEPEPFVSRSRVILPGDLLIFTCESQPELNYADRVSAEGDICIPRLGEFVLHGMTRQELERILRKRLLESFDSCEVHIEHEPARNRYHVLGAVRKPGARERSQPLNVFEAVMAELGEPDEQDLEHVTLYSPERVSPFVVTIDVQQMLRTGDTTRNVLLHDGDQLLIPWGSAEPNSLDSERAFQKYTSPYVLDWTAPAPVQHPDGSYNMDDAQRWLEEEGRRWKQHSVEQRFKGLVEAALHPQLARLRTRLEENLLGQNGGRWTIELFEGTLSVRHASASGESMTLAGGPKIPGPVAELRAWLKDVQAFRTRSDTAESERLNPGIRPAHPRFRVIEPRWRIRVPADTSLQTLSGLTDVCEELGLAIGSIERRGKRMDEDRKTEPSESRPGAVSLFVIYVSRSPLTKAEASGVKPTPLNYQLVLNSAAGASHELAAFETRDLAILGVRLAEAHSSWTANVVLVVRRENVSAADTEHLLRLVQAAGFSSAALPSTY